MASQKSAEKDIMPYPHVIMDCTVQLERLDPEMPQTQKEKPTKRIQKYSEGKMYQRVRRKDMTKGFLLLRKCVPGTKKLNHSDMLMETVNYIKELQNKIKELEKESLKESKKTVNYIKELENKIKELEKESPMESTSQTPKGMGRDSVPKITLHYYGTEQDCTDSALREPHSSPMETDISEPEMAEESFIPVKTFASTPTGASLRKTSCVMDAAVQTTSEAESVTPEEELLASPDEELLASEEELPEFNSMEDFTQWLDCENCLN